MYIEAIMKVVECSPINKIKGVEDKEDHHVKVILKAKSGFQMTKNFSREEWFKYEFIFQLGNKIPVTINFSPNKRLEDFIEPTEESETESKE